VPSPTLLRSDVALLADEARGDLAALWREVETAQAVEAALRDVLPSLIETYGVAASAVAADWYDETRDEVGAPGRFTAIPADIPDVRAQSLVGWALDEATDFAAFQTLVEGGTQRRIANFSRLTVSRSSIADRAARGWKRVGIGQCDFCRMLIGRGAVYTEATVDFHAHDHCNCSPAPAWA
jgi:hypothetical protein